VRVSIWPAGAAGPAAPVRVSRAPYTSGVAVVRSGDRAWVAWLEGSTRKLDTMAAVRVRGAGVGTVRRRSLPAGTLHLIANDPPTVAAASGGGLRWYTLSRARGESTLSTIVLDRGGHFSSPKTITHDVSVSLTQLTAPAPGAPADLVGWTTSTTDARGTRSFVAWPAEPGRHAP
jgi:hypothetical protein